MMVLYAHVMILTCFKKQNALHIFHLRSPIKSFFWLTFKVVAIGLVRRMKYYLLQAIFPQRLLLTLLKATSVIPSVHCLALQSCRLEAWTWYILKLCWQVMYYHILTLILNETLTLIQDNMGKTWPRSQAFNKIKVLHFQMGHFAFN